KILSELVKLIVPCAIGDGIAIECVATGKLAGSKGIGKCQGDRPAKVWEEGNGIGWGHGKTRLRDTLSSVPHKPAPAEIPFGSIPWHIQSYGHGLSEANPYCRGFR